MKSLRPHRHRYAKVLTPTPTPRSRSAQAPAQATGTPRSARTVPRHGRRTSFGHGHVRTLTIDPSNGEYTYTLDTTGRRCGQAGPQARRQAGTGLRYFTFTHLRDEHGAWFLNRHHHYQINGSNDAPVIKTENSSRRDSVQGGQHRRDHHHP